ncbi:putative formate dehydrogenase-associated protein [Campylobacter pinnipediorum subsp. caledonicus]|uniref:Putative formate dehydrogenase-associated protein n=1 Tax=Campylobacter pinnipediorum subsp. caledonicus TaxID=1874362 RepID=A0A1S6U9A5_9BACT|nr:Tat pathway signal protein [Campylobacter pinnipediorum]AQW88326.1 putative formate dehydrogenase-associated protein [Campylobacter pinnipediorum subsp. caledonicus]OPA70632.1 Tat pathway signal protein [Campylobacter pinnipediorum subsp. caledonicus]
MKVNRREFLRKALKVSTLAGGVVATNTLADTAKISDLADSNGVVVGKSNKKEVLYHKTQMWEHFYKIAY